MPALCKTSRQSNGIPGLTCSCQHLHGDVKGSVTKLSTEQTEDVGKVCGRHLLPIIEKRHEHLNSLRPSMQFTVEMEENGSLPFLDTLVRCNDSGMISTSVYRIHTHTRTATSRTLPNTLPCEERHGFWPLPLGHSHYSMRGQGSKGAAPHPAVDANGE